MSYYEASYIINMTSLLSPQFMSLFTILRKCFFLKVTVKAVTKLDNKAAHCHSIVPQRHCPFL